MTRRAADRASGVKEPTWRRLERGEGVSAGNLYRMLAAIHVDEDGARHIFEELGLDFDASAYVEPEPVSELRRHLRQIRRSAEEAEAVVARIEHDLRGR